VVAPLLAEQEELSREDEALELERGDELGLAR